MTEPFDFGDNWRRFSEARLDDVRFGEAVRSLEQLFPEGALRGRSMLDVGCGTGLFSIAAARLGARPVLGIDINPTCIAVSEENRGRFGHGVDVTFRVISVLDPTALQSLGPFDVVYAWGSLHHTGRMWEAIENVSRAVAPGGTLVLAIYAKHFTSPAWSVIKRSYNAAPGLVRRAMLSGMAPVIYAAKFLVTRQNPLRKDRGMDFWFDVVDWVGGYPYEYASPEEVSARMTAMGFLVRDLQPASVPTGCNEFVLERATS
jgi:2-polyprenyl-6-hydroxyphenyl methylase/3-demethylubiquinone-9 3-methyltransferase